MSRVVVMIFFNEKKLKNLIFNDTSEHVMLVQVIDAADNVNYALIITGCWINVSNNQQAVTLIKVKHNFFSLHLKMRGECIINLKMSQNRILPSDLNHIYYVNILVIWI